MVVVSPAGRRQSAASLASPEAAGGGGGGGGGGGSDRLQMQHKVALRLLGRAGGGAGGASSAGSAGTPAGLASPPLSAAGSPSGAGAGGQGGAAAGAGSGRSSTDAGSPWATLPSPPGMPGGGSAGAAGALDLAPAAESPSAALFQSHYQNSAAGSNRSSYAGGGGGGGAGTGGGGSSVYTSPLFSLVPRADGDGGSDDEEAAGRGGGGAGGAATVVSRTAALLRAGGGGAGGAYGQPSILSPGLGAGSINGAPSADYLTAGSSVLSPDGVPAAAGGPGLRPWDDPLFAPYDDLDDGGSMPVLNNRRNNPRTTVNYRSSAPGSHHGGSGAASPQRNRTERHAAPSLLSRAAAAIPNVPWQPGTGGWPAVDGSDADPGFSYGFEQDGALSPPMAVVVGPNGAASATPTTGRRVEVGSAYGGAPISAARRFVPQERASYAGPRSALVIHRMDGVDELGDGDLLLGGARAAAAAGEGGPWVGMPASGAAAVSGSGSTAAAVEEGAAGRLKRLELSAEEKEALFGRAGGIGALPAVIALGEGGEGLVDLVRVDLPAPAGSSRSKEDTAAAGSGSGSGMGRTLHLARKATRTWLPAYAPRAGGGGGTAAAAAAAAALGLKTKTVPYRWVFGWWECW